MPELERSKVRGKSTKPKKPYPGFPLFAHVSGRWGKKVRTRTCFFGRWGHRRGDRIVPVADVKASAKQALREFERQWPYLSQGQPPPSAEEPCCTMQQLCTAFLAMKKTRMDGGELSPHSYGDYCQASDRLLAFFGGACRVDRLGPQDFEKFRQFLAQGCGVVSLGSKINKSRVVLKYASDHGLIDHPVKYGRAFDRPSAKVLRVARNAAGERMFEAEELRRILAGADTTMRAMVLLGVNCGFGNTDVALLPQSAVDFDGGWIEFPRPKTAMRRRIPIWPETVTALRNAIFVRPPPKTPEDANLCFLTARGTRYVRAQESQTTPGRYLMVNALARRFEMLLERVNITGRRGRGFYTLRHVFETIAGESRDQVVVDAIMGHVDRTMAGQYRERISDERLRAVVDCVRTWLFPEPVRLSVVGNLAAG